MQIIYDWFSLLNAGHKISGIGASDSHTVNFVIPGQARTYLPIDDSDPSILDVEAACDAIVAGKTEVSFGLLCQLTHEKEKGLLRADVLGPDWSTASHLLLYADGKDVGLIEIPEAQQRLPGRKFQFEWSLNDEKHTALKEAKYLCAHRRRPRDHRSVVALHAPVPTRYPGLRSVCHGYQFAGMARRVALWRLALGSWLSSVGQPLIANCKSTLTP